MLDSKAVKIKCSVAVRVNDLRVSSVNNIQHARGNSQLAIDNALYLKTNAHL